MKRKICLIIIAIMFVGCRTKSIIADNEQTEVIEVAEDVTKSILDIARNYRYIALDVGNNVEAALGAITKLRVFQDRIYVMDNVFTDKLLIFDKDGTFLKKVSHLGRGPQEYVDLTTFELDYIREELLIKDDYGKKVLVFDLDGIYKRTIGNQNIRGCGIAVLPDGKMVYGVDAAFSNAGELNDFMLIICDRENNPLEWYCEDNTGYTFGLTSLDFMNPGFNGTVTFAPQLMNDIYRISDTDVARIYSINFPDMLDRKEYEKYSHPSSFNKSASANKTRFLGNHSDSKDYLHFEYIYQKEVHHAYYDKKDKSLLVCNDKMCARNLTFDEQNNLWGTLSMADIISDESAMSLEIQDTIMKSGNPVIVCYTLE